MSAIRRFIAIVMLCVLLLVLFTAASANSSMNTNWTIITPNINPYEYGYSPEHLYVFLYHGYSPYFSVDIDISMCTENRLYVYDVEQNTVTEMSDQQVTYYTCTKDALFFVTSTQEIYKTDYAGQNIEFLYQCEQGNISDFNNYLDTLYSIEDQNSIMLLDVASKTAQQIWEYETLDWAIMLNTSQLIATTAEDDNYLYDIPTNTATLISSIEATNLVTAAVKGTTSNNARTTHLSNRYRTQMTFKKFYPTLKKSRMIFCINIAPTFVIFVNKRTCPLL